MGGPGYPEIFSKNFSFGPQNMASRRPEKRDGGLRRTLYIDLLRFSSYRASFFWSQSFPSTKRDTI